MMATGTMSPSRGQGYKAAFRSTIPLPVGFIIDNAEKMLGLLLTLRDLVYLKVYLNLVLLF